jgi:hypothetical protein
MMNIISALEGPGGEFYRAVGSTLSEVFDRVYVFGTQPGRKRQSQNIILVATGGPVDVPGQIAAAGLQRQTRNRFSASYLGPVRKSGPVLTDARNPVEFMVARSQLQDADATRTQP